MAKPTYTRTPGKGRPLAAEQTQEIQAFANPLSGPQRTLPVRTPTTGQSVGAATQQQAANNVANRGNRRGAFSGVVALAPLTGGGSAGSLTFVDGICTAVTPPT